MRFTAASALHIISRHALPCFVALLRLSDHAASFASITTWSIGVPAGCGLHAGSSRTLCVGFSCTSGVSGPVHRVVPNLPVLGHGMAKTSRLPFPHHGLIADLSPATFCHPCSASISSMMAHASHACVMQPSSCHAANTSTTPEPHPSNRGTEAPCLMCEITWITCCSGGCKCHALCLCAPTPIVTS